MKPLEHLLPALLLSISLSVLTVQALENGSIKVFQTTIPHCSLNQDTGSSQATVVQIGFKTNRFKWENCLGQ
ncbi:hypothetical protein NBRC116493_11920 [Aurantivibrio infirmus]